MKKISLKSVKEYLSRDEMKSIMGGSGTTFGCNYRAACSTGCAFFTSADHGYCNYCCLA